MTKDNDGWGTPWPVIPTPLCEDEGCPQAGTPHVCVTPEPWPVHPDQTSPMTVGPEDWMQREADAAQYAGVKEPWPEFVARNYNDDGLGNLTAKRGYVEGPDAWPVNPEDAGDGEPRDMMDEPEFGTYGASDDERARAANACMSIDPETPWVVDVPDGELTLKEDYMPTVTMGEETGVYVAYSQGVLHAVLAGPYPDVAAARLKLDEVWRRFEADPAMPHAFTKSDWNRAGLYMAEIPLKARRKGAYGAI